MGGKGSGTLKFTETEKWCSGCEKWLPHAAFSKNKWTKSGLQVYCDGCRPRVQAEYYTRPEVRKRLIDNTRNWQRAKLGVTVDDVQQMLEQQEHRCAICGDPITFRAHLDHDHKTGKVRGLLCPSCNHGLGKFKDSQDILLKAAEYLKVSLSNI